MNEGEIRMQAQMYALVADMEAIKIDVEARKSANADRITIGHEVIYGEDVFDEYAIAMRNAAYQLRSNI